MNACQAGVGLDGSSLRRLTLLVGAMLMAVAMFGVGASSASAEPVGIYMSGEASEEEAEQPIFEAESYPLFIEGTSQSEHQFTFNAGSFQCSEFDLQKPGGTEKEEVTEATRTLAFEPTPQISSCSTTPSNNFEFYRNGCLFVMDVLNVGPPYAGQMAIDCPTETGIRIVAKSESETTLCTITMLPQAGLQGIGLENTGSGSESVINTDFEVSGIKYTQLGLCSIGKEKTEFEDGTFTGESELFGDDE